MHHLHSFCPFYPKNQLSNGMVNKGLHLKSSTLRQKTNKQKVYLEVNDTFDIKRHFLVNASLFWGPGFCKHSLQLFLVSVIPKLFMSYCGYRWITWFPSGTQYSRCSARAEQPHLQFRWGSETTLFLIEAKKNCIDLSWIYGKLSNHILLGEPLMVVSWRISFVFSHKCAATQSVSR